MLLEYTLEGMLLSASVTILFLSSSPEFNAENWRRHSGEMSSETYSVLSTWITYRGSARY